MAMVRGFESKVDIVTTGGTTAYNARSWTIAYSTTPNDVSGTEGKPGDSTHTGIPGLQSRLGGLEGARVTLNGVTFDPAANEFGSPLNLRASNFVKVKIYPAGRALPFHDIHILVSSCTQQMNDPGGLIPFTLEGESDGTFTIAT